MPANPKRFAEPSRRQWESRHLAIVRGPVLDACNIGGSGPGGSPFPAVCARRADDGQVRRARGWSRVPQAQPPHPLMPGDRRVAVSSRTSRSTEESSVRNGAALDPGTNRTRYRPCRRAADAHFGVILVCTRDPCPHLRCRRERCALRDISRGSGSRFDATSLSSLTVRPCLCG